MRTLEVKSVATCAVCGAQFLAKRSDSKGCSIECKRVLANTKARRHEAKVRGHCADCGIEIARRSKRCVPCAAKHVVATGGRKGEKNWQWKGGRIRNKEGYVLLLTNPEEPKGHRYKAEHIVVWEKTHGKPVPDGWVIHHLNGIKNDNRPENLLATTRIRHNQQHFLPGSAFEPYQERIRQLEEQLGKYKPWKS